MTYDSLSYMEDKMRCKKFCGSILKRVRVLKWRKHAGTERSVFLPKGKDWELEIARQKREETKIDEATAQAFTKMSHFVFR